MARTQGALEELGDDIRAAGGSPATLVPLDVTHLDALDRLGSRSTERWGRLDVFLGNAGVLGALTPLAHLDQKVWDQTMAVTVTKSELAAFALFRSGCCAPRMRAVPSRHLRCGAFSGRRIGGLMRHRSGARGARGGAYAAETVKTKIRVMMLNPGPLRTPMRALGLPPGESPRLWRTTGSSSPPRSSAVGFAGKERDRQDLRSLHGPVARRIARRE